MIPEDGRPGMTVRFVCPEGYKDRKSWEALDGCVGILTDDEVAYGMDPSDNAMVRWQRPDPRSDHIHDEPAPCGWQFITPVITEPLDSIDNIEKYLNAPQPTERSH